MLKILNRFTIILILTAFIHPAENIMDEKNSSFAGTPVGFWGTVGCPNNWTSSNPAKVYTAGSRMIIIPPNLTVSYVSDRKVEANVTYWLQADLGGTDQTTALVVLLAVSGPEETDDAIELARVSSQAAGTTYELTTVFTNTAAFSKKAIGQYLKVELTCPDEKGKAYFKNIRLQTLKPGEPLPVIIVPSATPKPVGKTVEPEQKGTAGPQYEKYYKEMSSAERATMLKPAMTEEGKINVGSKSFWIKGFYSEIHAILADTIAFYGTHSFNFTGSVVNPVFFINRQIEKTNDSYTVKSDMVSARGETAVLGQYSISVCLLKDGLMKVTSKYSLNEGVNFSKPSFLWFRGPAPFAGFYEADGEIKEFQPSSVAAAIAGVANSYVTFFPDAPGKQFRIIPVTYSNMLIVPKNGQFNLFPKDNVLEFLVDLYGEKQTERSQEFYGGMDFKKVDGLSLPQYSQCRNLMNNPSFESDLRYYFTGLSQGTSAFLFQYTNVYSIDKHEAKYGKKSLSILAQKNSDIIPFSTWTMPLEPDTKYVLSFYAKGNVKTGIMLELGGRSLSPVYYLFPEKTVRNLAINDTWERYSFDFTALADFYVIYIKGLLDPNSQNSEGKILIDGLQLEKEILTDYTEPALSVQFSSAKRGNFLYYQEKPDFRLTLRGKPEQEGEIELSVTDYYYKEVVSRKYPFRIGMHGETLINLTDIGDVLLFKKLKGVFTVKVTTAMSNNETFIDFFRFSVMSPLTNVHKNKNIFNYAQRNTVWFDMEGPHGRLSRMRDIGFGSATVTQPPFSKIPPLLIQKHLIERLHYYGIADIGHSLINTRDEEGTIQEGVLKITNLRYMINPSDTVLNKYENICEIKARNRPWISVWYIAGEMEGFKPIVADQISFSKILLAGYRGIKKGNPQALVHFGGTPWNIQPDNGIKQLEYWLEGANKFDSKTKFDGTAIHVYQQMPEDPDLDLNIEILFKMLRRYGYGDIPIYLDEGLNYFEYLLPKLGMTPYMGNSGDGWFMGPLTYDMGWAERIAAAFTARSYLVGLKYHKNVACLNDFGFRRMFWDMELTVGAKAKVVNTLGHILGDADFFKDIRFAPNCRAYLFIDQKKRPVAAVWGHDTAVDKREAEAPVFRFDFSKQKVSFLDLMETPQTFPVNNGKTSIPITPFPLFITGESGKEVLLESAITGGENIDGNMLPITISASPIGPAQAEIILNNAVNVPVRINSELKLGIYSEITNLDIGSKGSLILTAPLTVEGEVLRSFNLMWNAKAEKYNEKKQAINGQFMFLTAGTAAKKIAIDGLADDWKDIKSFPLADTVTMKCAVGSESLYFAFEGPSEIISKKIIFIFDAFSDKKTWQDTKKVEQDLYVYEISNQKSVQCEAFCHAVPFVQSASGAWTPKAGRFDQRFSGKLGMVNGKTFLEVAVQSACVMPLTFRMGERFGLNIVIESKDKNLSLAPLKDYQGAKQPGEVRFVLCIIQ